MTEIRQYRQQPDLIRQITDLVRRIIALETARRLGNASVDSGELTVRNGDIVVRNSNDNPVLILEAGDAPLLKFIPDFGEDSYYGSILGWESEAGASLELGIKQVNGSQDGGKLLLQQGGVYLSKQPASGEEAYLSIGIWPEYQTGFYLRGSWIVGQHYHSTDALVFGIENVAAGVSSVSVVFAIPYTTIPFLTYSLVSASGAVPHSITALNTTGFTISWTGTTAKTVQWQAWRRP